MSARDVVINEKAVSSDTLPKLGRPKGSKNATTILRERMVDKSTKQLAKDLHKIVKVVQDKAEEGDLTACKMIFDRFFVVVKQTDGEDNSKASQINIIVQGTEQAPKVIEGEVVDV